MKKIKRYLPTALERRKNRVRNMMRAQNKPRICVFRSGSYIYAQIISGGQTLASASSIEKAAKDLVSKSDCKAAHWVGQELAKRGLEAQIKDVVFDRGSYLYHGRIKALAEGAREAGLNF